DPDSWLPSPDELEVTAKRRNKGPAAQIDLSPEDRELLEVLRSWRLKTARGKPAYTVANNRTLEGIAASRPGDAEGLPQTHGVGPTFLDRDGEDVLVLVAQH